MTPGLFDLFELVPRPCRTGSRSLVVLDTTACPDCGSPLRRVTADEGVLFRHGGYGATRHSISDHCENVRCRWTILREVSELRPEVPT